MVCAMERIGQQANTTNQVLFHRGLCDAEPASDDFLRHAFHPSHPDYVAAAGREALQQMGQSLQLLLVGCLAFRSHFINKDVQRVRILQLIHPDDGIASAAVNENVARDREEKGSRDAGSLALGRLEHPDVDVVANVLHVGRLGQPAPEESDKCRFMTKDFSLEPGFDGIGHHGTVVATRQRLK